MRIFKNKFFNRYARKQDISDAQLCKAVAEIQSGLVDADYGGNLFKKRIPRKGGGKSGGHRAILAYVKGNKTFFMYAFEKSAKDNIAKDEERDYKKLAKAYIALNNAQLALAMDENVLFEVNCHEENL
ncbi:MAG: type II toxin-antitoxin system RelE/ParE family toxin [Rhodospirillales bacterium]|nr:type II toxin-antitoxin system RelE/ParE family toxin [Rhodospirillales bacterium]